MADSVHSRAGAAYRTAGVDIDAADALVGAYAPLAAKTRRPGAESSLGGFGGLFDLAAAGYRDPLLVAATDGVGTKLKIALEMDRHHGIGIDLVAMNANDLVVQGAEPLFFLDYFATGRLQPTITVEVVAGIAEGCRAAGCALIGGETAEMPGLYSGSDYDLAGFCVGAVERDRLLDGRRQVAAGDVVLGLASDGLHANGFSLVRKVVADSGLAWTDPAPFAPNRSLGEALLHPTRLYVGPLLEALEAGGITALAHITGGGLLDNPPRVFADDLTLRLQADAWPMPAVFRWLADSGQIPPRDMARTFNNGLGLLLFCRPDRADALTGQLTTAGESVWTVGRMETRPPGGTAVILEGWEDRWR